ncbi:MAG: DUF4271 domain-containing protein [Prevotellaceae bacterium]|jgi:hypothetical protein|nr:DUF4271 domain-containing protein [Prevotellaceae bacterium]
MSIQSVPYVPAADSAAACQQPRAVFGSNAPWKQFYTNNIGIGLPRPNMVPVDFTMGLTMAFPLFLLLFIYFFRKQFSLVFQNFFRFKLFWSFRRTQPWVNLPFRVLLFVFSAFSLSLLITESVQQFSPAFADEAFSALFFPVCVATGIFLLLRLLGSHIVGAVSTEKQLFSDILYAQFLLFALMSVAIGVAFLLKIFLDKMYSNIIIVPLYIALGFFLCSYFFRTVRLFMQWENAIFFWFLYFCTFEILPLVIIVKFIDEF